MHVRPLASLVALLLAAPLIAQTPVPAGPPTDAAHRSLAPRTSTVLGEGRAFFRGNLEPGDAFGFGVAPLGDFDADGVPDLAVLGGGSLWLLRLNRAAFVLREHELTAAELGFSPSSVDGLGDLDGDGVLDVVLGDTAALGDPGAVHVVFLNADGGVRSSVRIDETPGASGADLGGFGRRVTALDDLDGNGARDLAVAANASVWVVRLNTDGTELGRTEFFPGHGGFPEVPTAFDPRTPAWIYAFGNALDSLGDLDGDGVGDLLVSGQEWMFEGQIGHVFLVHLASDGTVASMVDVNTVDLGLWSPPDPCAIWYGDRAFGWGAAALGDVDGNGVVDLAVGAPLTLCCLDDPSTWILSLRADGSVRRTFEVTAGSPPYDLEPDPLGYLGWSIAGPGDIDGDGRPDVAIGAPASLGTPSEFCEVNEDPLGLVYVLF